jgi:hypothetical protein
MFIDFMMVSNLIEYQEEKYNTNEITQNYREKQNTIIIRDILDDTDNDVSMFNVDLNSAIDYSENINNKVDEYNLFKMLIFPLMFSVILII